MKTFLIIAGEASGDVYGGMFINAVKNLSPQVRFIGIGGPRMRSAGLETLECAENLSVIGIFEVLENLRVIIKAYNAVKRVLKNGGIDGVVLIDFPDFNFRVGKLAKQLGIKVFYFVIPQVWAWRQYRLKVMKKFVTKCVPIIPFEVELLKKYEIDSYYAGHPLLDISVPDLERDKLLQEMNIPEDAKVIALFPGSRKREVNMHLPIILETAQKIYREDQSFFFIVSCAPTIERKLIESYVENIKIPLKISAQSAANILSISYAGIAVSGTIALEAAIAQKPMVIIYKLNWLSYFMVKPLVRIRYVSLPNLILNKPVYPELLQENLTPQNLLRTFMEILREDRYNNIIHELKKVRETLGGPGVFQRVSRVFLDLMG